MQGKNFSLDFKTFLCKKQKNETLKDQDDDFLPTTSGTTST